MLIRTMWGKREPGNLAPELMVAWDEFCIDAYPEGFTHECDEVRASWADDLAAWRMVDIQVKLDQVEAAFLRPVIEGDVG